MGGKYENSDKPLAQDGRNGGWVLGGLIRTRIPSRRIGLARGWANLVRWQFGIRAVLPDDEPPQPTDDDNDDMPDSASVAGCLMPI